MKAIFDPKMSISDNWLAAIPLYAAWMIYAEVEQQNDYRDSGQNAHRSAALQYMMQRDLGDKVGENELWAIGIPLPSKPEMLPELIPQIMFASDDASIDWENSIIRALDREYGQVRICSPNSLSEIQPAFDSSVLKRGGGRHSAYTKARIILMQLFDENAVYQTASAAVLLDIFNERYLEQYGKSGLKVSPVSERSLRTYLKKYRQELAAIGKI